jgi:NhaP-type Na+/H+ or K+/H+ antiporter
MNPALIGAGLGVAIGVLIAQRIQRRKNAKLVPAIEAALREQGALTLPALAEAIGLGGFVARGRVAMALNDLAAKKRLRTIPAPDGTPQLQKINFIKYELIG